MEPITPTLQDAHDVVLDILCDIKTGDVKIEQPLLATLGSSIGVLCDAIARETDIQYKQIRKVYNALFELALKKKELKLCFAALSSAIHSSFAACAERNADAVRLDRLRPNILAIMKHAQQCASEVTPDAAKHMCELLGYDANDIEFMADLVEPYPLSAHAEEFMHELRMLDEKGYIETKTRMDLLWAFVPEEELK